MESSKECNRTVSPELIAEANEEYESILKTRNLKELIIMIEHELFESERDEILDMTIEEFLRDWSRYGLY